MKYPVYPLQIKSKKLVRKHNPEWKIKSLEWILEGLFLPLKRLLMGIVTIFFYKVDRNEYFVTNNTVFTVDKKGNLKRIDNSILHPSNSNVMLMIEHEEETEIS